MAAPFDDATTWLTGQSAMIRQVYHDSFYEMHSRYGSNTNRWFKPSSRIIEGDGINVQVMDGNMYAARMNNDMNADFSRARAFSSATYKVTLSENPSSNDFRRLDIALQISHLDLERNYTNAVSSASFLERLLKQSMQNIGETTALHRHLDRTAHLATISGTPKQNDNNYYASATATPTATSGVRAVITGGSIAAFQKNVVLDCYSSTGTYRFKVYVTDYNPRDSSVGFWGVDASENGSSTVDISAMAAGDNLYISGELNKGLISIGEWFKAPTSGESFYGKDRTLANNRWLRPHISGPSSSSIFTKAILDDAMRELGYIEEQSDGGYAMVTTPELEQRYRQEIGEDVLIQFPSDEQKGKLIANYGFDGNMYRHPLVGRIMLTADAFATPNRIRMLRAGDWETQYAGNKTFQWLPGDTGGWYRMQSAVPGGGRTTIYKMDGFVAFADICLRPRVQVEIGNITAS